MKANFQIEIKCLVTAPSLLRAIFTHKEYAVTTGKASMDIDFVPVQGMLLGHFPIKHVSIIGKDEVVVFLDGIKSWLKPEEVTSHVREKTLPKLNWGVFMKFKFENLDLQKRVIGDLHASNSQFRLLPDTTVEFEKEDMETDDYGCMLEDVILRQIRGSVFDKWQLLSCPPESVDSYKEYMGKHGIEYEIEIHDGMESFLLSQEHDPDSWEGIV